MSDDTEGLGDLFADPEGFYAKPPPPKFDVFERDIMVAKDSPVKSVKVRLVGKSPLWGHLLWNAGKSCARYIDRHSDRLCAGKTVLELGAGAGVPGLVSAITASNVVLTDYPDPDLIANLNENVAFMSADIQKRLKVCGLIWGNEVDEIVAANNGNKFDLVILADLIFNHTEHDKLLRTIERTISDTGVAVVFFTPHRPHLLHTDLAFFDNAKTRGFTVRQVAEETWSPMFTEKEDPNTAQIRSMVYGYEISK
ncbi:hypothetical protein CANCADRAFT_1320 [Tortispora caseinolytica NRRL Y-17796]|uniref:Elongation factor methyltransferase 7 n=1 Tax=Tortispora caseinolytica NRRL Y-17796 TaxID=767744 RepID=A0A1E4TLU9_9ASCO|nr:hypothetical protein CANCADRAFT_1320 [Tortispora caseinolytica NRRL Y-17796]